MNTFLRGTSRGVQFSEEMHLVMKEFERTAESFGMNPVFLPLINFSDHFAKYFFSRHQVYEFSDRSGRNIALSPEHTVIANLTGKKNMFYILPTFRYERPQKDRFRQFWQMGVESDLNVVEIACDFFSGLNLDFKLKFHTVGTVEQRKNFWSVKRNVCPECEEYLKNGRVFVVFKHCSHIFEEFLNSLHDEQISKIDEWKVWCADRSIKYENVPVFRGFDYYDGMAFEFEIDGVVVGGGGEYLHLGERKSGFALGCERVAGFVNNSSVYFYPFTQNLSFLFALKKSGMKVTLFDGKEHEKTVRERKDLVELRDGKRRKTLSVQDFSLAVKQTKDWYEYGQ